MDLSALQFPDQHILKFSGLNQIFNKSKLIISENFQSSQLNSESHLFSKLKGKTQYSKPQQSESFSHNEQYVQIFLPPISTYNPLMDQSKEVQRPIMSVKQINTYASEYNKVLTEHGYKKKQGLFEGYLELINKNKMLIKQSPRNRRKSSLYRGITEPKASVPQFTRKKLDLYKNFDLYQDQEQYNSEARKQYLAHDNRVFNSIQHTIDKNMIESKLNISRAQSLGMSKNYSNAQKFPISPSRKNSIDTKQQLDNIQQKSSSSVDGIIMRKLMVGQKINKKISNFQSIGLKDSYGKIKEELSVSNYIITEDDKTKMNSNSSHFDQKIKEYQKLKQLKDIHKGYRFK